ncbi:hypothetical protein Trydic_g14338 [Trypoxylus dichotomus]
MEPCETPARVVAQSDVWSLATTAQVNRGTATYKRTQYLSSNRVSDVNCTQNLAQDDEGEAVEEEDEDEVFLNNREKRKCAGVRKVKTPGSQQCCRRGRCENYETVPRASIHPRARHRRVDGTGSGERRPTVAERRIISRQLAIVRSISVRERGRSIGRLSTRFTERDVERRLTFRRVKRQIIVAGGAAIDTDFETMLSDSLQRAV